MLKDKFKDTHCMCKCLSIYWETKFVQRYASVSSSVIFKDDNTIRGWKK